MTLSSQKRMASSILKCAEDKIWIDPDRYEDVSQAITRTDIRKLVLKGVIKKKRPDYQSRGRARKILVQKKKGRRKGTGKRKGKRGSRVDKKDEWMKTVRALRKNLREIRDREEITKSEYRKLYLMVKGGFFRNKSHLNLHIKKMKGQ